MKSSTGQVFEVRCPGCGVSFPPGTKSCLHCGSRIRRGRPSVTGASVPSSLPQHGASAFEKGSRPAEDSDLPAWLEGEETLDEHPEQGRPRWMRWGSSALWIVVAIAATLSQMCGRG